MNQFDFRRLTCRACGANIAGLNAEDYTRFAEALPPAPEPGAIVRAEMDMDWGDGSTRRAVVVEAKENQLVCPECGLLGVIAPKPGTVGFN